jgi:hypothetical protein
MNTLREISRAVLETFSRAQQSNLPLTDLYLHFSGLTVTARELKGGALIFLNPATLNFSRSFTPPAMHYKSIEDYGIGSSRATTKTSFWTSRASSLKASKRSSQEQTRRPGQARTT